MRVQKTTRSLAPYPSIPPPPLVAGRTRIKPKPPSSGKKKGYPGSALHIYQQISSLRHPRQWLYFQFQSVSSSFTAGAILRKILEVSMVPHFCPRRWFFEQAKSANVVRGTAAKHSNKRRSPSAPRKKTQVIINQLIDVGHTRQFAKIVNTSQASAVQQPSGLLTDWQAGQILL